MGKKKLSLKPVQRGFATTSVATKKPPAPPKEKAEGREIETDASPATAGLAENAGQDSQDQAVSGAADWEDDEAIERNALQALVDKLHEKGEKEVARIIKSIEYDRRLATSFPKLEINQEVRDRVLELALEEEQASKPESNNGESSKYITPASSTVESDKALSRLYIAFHVLRKLGFRDERIEECIMQGVGEGEGWEEALEWMWAHLSEDECLQRGEYAKREEPSLEQPQETLVEALPEADPQEAATEEAPKPISATPQTTTAESSAPTSLFQSTASSPFDSDSDDDLNTNQANETWAKLSLELDTLKLAAGGGAGKGKGKKGKGNGVVLETPEMRRLKERIGKVEKEYMFSRKDADVILKALKSQRDAAALAARLKGTSVNDTPPNEASKPEDVGEAAHDGSPNNLLDGSEDEGEGGLFGGMLDEPASAPGEDQKVDSNSLITVRPMPIPKQASFAGTIPKNVLKSSLAKSTKQVVISFVRLSGSSRAARAGLEIRWNPKRRRVWRMDDIACDDMAEAENYVATLALNELAGDGELVGVNWRTMPPAYRELWEELEVKRKEREDSGKREVWAKIKALYERKAIAPAADGKNEGSKATAGGIDGTTSTGARDVEERYSEKLQTDFERRRTSTAYQNMLRHRDQLPIASFRDQIVSTLDSNQIMVLSGETGCGKSTQLPSFILEDQLAKGKPCKIFVTEPRRISAISLAQRVSQELGDASGAMGTNSSLVGYSIRLEAKVSASTRLAFVTNGIALRMLEGGSGGGSKGTAFDEVTHIIVDEVHERSIESDFLLIVLKNLLEQRKDLKVVLMSATLDAEKISSFFGGCPFLSVPGRTFPVQVNYLEDAVQVADWQIDESSPYALRGRNFKPASQMVEWNEEGAKTDSESDEEDQLPKNPSKLSSAKYSSKTVSTINLLDSRQIAYDLIARLLEKICYESPELEPFSKATLIFMPGLAEIRKMNDLLQSHPAFGSRDFVVYPLHSTISSEGQSAVFDLPPKGVRKIVISTNIAETGVTIPDITCVIDSGKHREMRYDEKRQISRLVETYIARSNAKQRRGRAGRVQEGLAFHLFTKARHDTQLAEHPIPEMLRLSLQDLALRIKILKVPLGSSIESVLLQALDPPSSTNIQRAIASLVDVKALTPNEEITPMGRLLSKLPMDVHLGKFLLVAALFRCLDPALTVAATLNSKSPFVTPFGFEGAADAAKQGFAIGNSDFLTIANVFDSWRRASDNPNFVRIFCKRNFVSQQNLQQIEELRQQLLAYLLDSAFVEATPAQRQEISQARFSRGFRTRFVNVPSQLNSNADNVQIVGAALAAGLYPKLLSLDSAAGGLRTIINQQPVAIHPSSINFKTPKSDFGTNYLAYFTIMQSKKLYAWETGPVDDRALVLLCGDLADFRLPSSSFHLDRKIRYSIPPKTALALKYLREQFAQAMSARLRGKSLGERGERWFDLGLECLSRPIWEEEQGRVGVV